MYSHRDYTKAPYSNSKHDQRMLIDLNNHFSVFNYVNEIACGDKELINNFESNGITFHY
jgi:hypothetical protein